MERVERMEESDDIRRKISMFNIWFHSSTHSVHYMLHHSNPPHKGTISIILHS